jgi:hypothetical protein
MQTPTCSLRANTVSVHSSQGYAEALQVDAQVSGGGLGWSFSASGDYAKTSQALNSYSRTQYQTTATCYVYTADTLAFHTLQLTPEFVRGVSSLSAAYDEKMYLAFVKDFGTHFVNHIAMGAKFIFSMEFDTRDVQSMSSTGVDVAAAVSVQMVIAHGDASTDVKWHRADYANMSQFVSTASQIIIGQGPPSPFVCTQAPCSPADMNLTPWQTALLRDDAQLVPLSYALESLESLLTKEYFPNDADIAVKQLNFYTFLSRDYCRNVPGCAPPNPYGYWMQQPPLVLGRVAAAGVVSGSFFVLGGLDPSSQLSSSTVQMLVSQDSGVKWSLLTKSPMPTARHNFSAAIDADGAIYAFGGLQLKSGGAMLVVGAVERLDVRTLEWSKQSDMPNPRFSHATANVMYQGSNQIWVMGGNLRGLTTSSVDAYHTDTSSWKPAPSMTTPREGHCVGVLGGVLYVVGGFDGTNFLSSVEALVDGTWVVQPQMSYARSGAVCAVAGNSIVVSGGAFTAA